MINGNVKPFQRRKLLRSTSVNIVKRTALPDGELDGESSEQLELTLSWSEYTNFDNAFSLFDTEQIKWISDKNLNISGFQYLSNSSYLRIEFRHNQWKKWYTKEEFDDLSYYYSLNLYISNEYLDTSDLNNPIKSSFKSFKFIVQPSTITYGRLGIVKNTYEIDKGFIYPDVKSGSFYEMSKDMTTSTIRNIDRVRFAKFDISMQSQAKHYEVNVYTIFDLSGTIGGIFELAILSVSFFVSLLRDSRYTYSLLNEIRVKTKIDGRKQAYAINPNEQSEAQNCSGENSKSQGRLNDNISDNEAEFINQNPDSSFAIRYPHLHRI